MINRTPFFALVMALLAASIAVLAQANGFGPLVGVVAVFMVGQVVESMLLTPWLVGDRIGLHPVAVIFAVMAGGQLFGFTGVLLGLPLAAVVAVLLRHAMARWRDSEAYNLP